MKRRDFLKICGVAVGCPGLLAKEKTLTHPCDILLDSWTISAQSTKTALYGFQRALMEFNATFDKARNVIEATRPVIEFSIAPIEGLEVGDIIDYEAPWLREISGEYKIIKIEK